MHKFVIPPGTNRLSAGNLNHDRVIIYKTLALHTYMAILFMLAFACSPDSNMGAGNMGAGIPEHLQMLYYDDLKEYNVLGSYRKIWSENVSESKFDEETLKNPGNKDNQFLWEETDSTLSFYKGENLVWQYNFRNRFGKPYFHPIYLNNIRLTCESPPDHVWHYGLWFSWKFINGLNYWEYRNEYSSEKTGYKSEGNTDIHKIYVKKNPDYSTVINLDVVYHPEGEAPVLREKRTIYIAPPDNKGEYYLDYEHEFIADYVDVVIDRTPILGEPEGKSWGGYGGLSLRFNQDFTKPVTVPDPGPITPPDYPENGWFYMGFTSSKGEKAGAAVFQHPDFTTDHTRWYFIKDPDQPFFFLSPAAVYGGKIKLQKGKSLLLKYRVWILAGTNEETLAAKYHHFIYE